MQIETLMANPNVEQRIHQPVGLTLSAVDFLDNISYKLMTSESDLEQVWRLRHHTYHSVGYLDGDENGLFSDDLDFVENVYNVGIFLEDRLASCVRLHVVDQSHAASCATGIFPEHIEMKRAAGNVMVDTSRFCCDQLLASRHRGLPLAAIRATGLLAVHRNAQATLATTTKEHIPFFKRVLGATAWLDEPVVYQSLAEPTAIYLYGADMSYLRHAAMTKQQYFLSSPSERHSLFDAKDGAFVRPTAKDILSGKVVDPYWS